MKQKVFSEIDKHADDDIIIASSTSCIMPSKFTSDLEHKAQCIVAHPVSRKSASLTHYGQLSGLFWIYRCYIHPCHHVYMYLYNSLPY